MGIITISQCSWTQSGRCNELYGVSAIPRVAIIGKDGVIREHFVGGRNEASLRKAIQSVLAKN